MGESITVYESGTYSVTVDDGTGCMYKDTKDVIFYERGCDPISSGGNCGFWTPKKTLLGFSSSCPPWWDVPIIFSYDPNDILGNIGYEEDMWVSVNERLGYVIRFENDAEFATGPAQTVTIRHQLDPNVDPYTLRLGDFGFGSFNFSVPPNSITHSNRLDVSDSLGVFVDVIAGIDAQNNEAFWILKSVDPATGQTPIDAALGFLEVTDTTITRFNDSIPKPSEGFVSFSIMPNSALLTGDTILADASIIFDENAPIETNVWKNTIDAFPPSTSMNPVDTVIGSSIYLSWNSIDDTGGVGVENYDLYISENGSDFKLYTNAIDTNYYEFTGNGGITYSYVVVARDWVGNVEELNTDEAVSIRLSRLTCDLDPEEDCNDNNACTNDYVNEETCECVNEPIENCEEVLGCIDNCAPNYNPDATVDDDSCELYDDTCPGDTCFSFYTWDTESCSCIEAIIDIFCDDENECTTDFVNEETCECVNELIENCNELAGCTDNCAPNYNPDATVDNGSCETYDDTCTESNCDTMFSWNPETCSCIKTPIDKSCDDQNDCTNDSFNEETCECVNELVEGCEEVCSNEAGLMPTANSFVCDESSTFINEAFSVKDENSVKAYLLHEEKSFNGEDYIVFQTGSRFESPGEGHSNVPLYVSAIIGPPTENGFPKLDDECTVWTPEGAYVVFFDPITITIENERCDAGQHFVDVSINGGVGGISPNTAYALVTDDVREYKHVSAGEVINFGPYTGSDNYSIQVEGAKGCSLNFNKEYDCAGLYEVVTQSNRDYPFVITHHPVSDIIIESAQVYNVNGQIVESSIFINGNSIEVDILSNRGIYLVELLLSNNEFDYVKLIK